MNDKQSRTPRSRPDSLRIGNVSLFSKVRQALEAEGPEYNEDAVNAVREQMIAEGVLGKGRGRGGSVYRKASAADLDAKSVGAVGGGLRVAACGSEDRGEW